MKLLIWHVDYVKWKAKSKAIKNLDVEIGKKEGYVENCALIFTCVEEGDLNKLNSVMPDLTNHLERIGVKTIVLYPYVHLFPEKLAKINEAIEVIKKLKELLENKGYKVILVAFGYYKEFELKCKGHPLAESSRRY